MTTEQTETMSANDAAALVTSVYEEAHGTWAVDDGHGNQIASGLASRAAAERVAARWVAARGR